MTADILSNGASDGNTPVGFVHQLLFYTSAEEFLATTVPFLRDGLDHDDALLVVTGETNTILLRDALGGDADPIDFADAADWYREPAQTLAAYGEYVGGHPGRRIRIVGEPVWNGRTEAGVREWARYESLCNAVFDGAPVLCICPYDVRALSDQVLGRQVLANALRTHPEQVIGTAGFPNRTYTERAELVVEPTPQNPSMSPAPATVVCFDRHDLALLRHLVAEHAHRTGMAAQRVAELVLLVNEGAQSAVQHGGGRGALRLWREGDQLACEVTSLALWPRGPFAGYVRRLVRRWSGPARTRPTVRWRSSDGGGCRGAGAGWDWPG